MRKSFSELHYFRTSMSLLLLGLREKDMLLRRSYVGKQTKISARTIANLENRQMASGKFLLRVFHYYIYLDIVTVKEIRLFFYLYSHLRRL